MLWYVQFNSDLHYKELFNISLPVGRTDIIYMVIYCLSYRRLQWIKQSIKNVLDDTENQSLSYITHKDIEKKFPDDQILVLEAPLGAQLCGGIKTLV